MDGIYHAATRRPNCADRVAKDTQGHAGRSVLSAANSEIPQGRRTPIAHLERVAVLQHLALSCLAHAAPARRGRLETPLKRDSIPRVSVDTHIIPCYPINARSVSGVGEAGSASFEATGGPAPLLPPIFRNSGRPAPKRREFQFSFVSFEAREGGDGKEWFHLRV